MALQYVSHFEKSCKSVYDPVLRKRKTVCDPLYSAEQWAALETALQASLGADFVSFEWADEFAKQTFTVTFNGTFDDQLQMEVPDQKLPIIDSTVQAWYLDIMQGGA